MAGAGVGEIEGEIETLKVRASQIQADLRVIIALTYG
jgi:hypothetical protein